MNYFTLSITGCFSGQPDNFYGTASFLSLHFLPRVPSAPKILHQLVTENTRNNTTKMEEGSLLLILRISFSMDIDDDNLGYYNHNITIIILSSSSPHSFSRHK